MYRNISCTTLVLASLVSGAATAATLQPTIDALNDLNTIDAVDPSWVIANNWATLDSNITSAPGFVANATVWDTGTYTTANDPCGNNWAGIYCDASGNLTHLEIPNAKMSGTITAVFAALDELKGTLISINLSGTVEADKNVLTGSIPADATGTGYSALVYLALNNTGGTGNIPDLTSYTNLTLANLYENGYTTYTGPVGGANMRTLNLSNNTGMTGDLAATVANSLALVTLDSRDTALTSGLNGVQNLQTAKGVSGDTITASWAPPSAGITPDHYRVSLSDDDGASYGTVLPNVTGQTVETSVLSDDTYIVRVEAATASGLISADPAYSAAIVIDTSGGSSGGGTGGGGTGGGGTGGGTGGSGDSGGGGAVLWLLALPLFGFARRK